MIRCFKTRCQSRLVCAFDCAPFVNTEQNDGPGVVPAVEAELA